MNIASSQSATWETRGLSVSIERAGKFEDLADIWRDLEARADTTFFLTWDWIGQWLEAIGESPYLLVVRSGDKIVGLGLLKRARLRRHLIFKANALLLNATGDPDRDIITIEYNGLLADRSFRDAVQEACIAFLAQARRSDGTGSDWDELHFPGVTEDFHRFAQGSGLLPWIYAEKPSWAIDLDAVRRSGRPYLDSISANTRYQIRRSIRLYEARGPLTCLPARDGEEATTFLDGLKELHQRYWVARGASGAFAFPFFERFHRAIIRQCLSRGTVEIIRIAAGDWVIGYLYNFVYAGWAGQYLSGFNYEPDAKLKPGLVSHCLCAERHLENNGRIYDFMAGANRYKASLGSPGPKMLHLVLQRPLLKFRVEQALLSFKRTLASRVGESAEASNGSAASDSGP